MTFVMMWEDLGAAQRGEAANFFLKRLVEALYSFNKEQTRIVKLFLAVAAVLFLCGILFGLIII